MLLRYAPLVDRKSLSRFRVRDGDTECGATIDDGGRANGARVEPRTVMGVATSHPVSGCERHPHPSSDQRVRGRGRRWSCVGLRR